MKINLFSKKQNTTPLAKSRPLLALVAIPAMVLAHPQKADVFYKGPIHANGIIEYFEQGNTGDCWFLSGSLAGSFTDFGKKVLHAMIQQDKKTGNVTAKLPHPDSKYTFTPQKIESEEDLSTGDADMRVIEMAGLEYRRKKFATGEYKKVGANIVNKDGEVVSQTGSLQSPLKNGYAKEAFEILFNKKGEFIDEDSTYAAKRDSAMKSIGKVPYLFEKLDTGAAARTKAEKAHNFFAPDYTQHNLARPQKTNTQKASATLKEFPTIQVDSLYKQERKEKMDSLLGLIEKRPDRYCGCAIFIRGSKGRIPNHEYAIRKVEKETVIVINPWDSSKKVHIPRKDFLATCERMDFLDTKI